MSILSFLLNPSQAKRSNLAVPEDWLIDALGAGSRSLSGERITPSSALRIGTYFACIRIVSEDTGKLPWHLFQRLPNGGRQRVIGHPVERLVHGRANSEMSSQTFRETLTGHALSTGNGYAEIQRRGDVPVALWPLDPSAVSLERDRDNGELVYVVRGPRRSEARLRPSSVFHLRGISSDGLVGYSVARLARESLGLASATEKSGAAFFGNSSRPSGILETPQALEDESRKKLKQAWQDTYGGVENAHRTAVLEAGTTFKATSIPNEDAQWLQSRRFSVQEIARWFRVPPSKVGDLTEANFSNIESQDRTYFVDTLTPWLSRWEHECQEKLISPADRDKLFTEHIVAGLLRGDTTKRFESYRVAIQSGWLSRNEARKLENMNPKPGLDEFLVPMNMGSTDGSAEPKQRSAEPVAKRAEAKNEKEIKMMDGLIEAAMPQMVAAFQNQLRVEADKATRAAKRGDLAKWSQEFYCGDKLEAVSHVRAAIIPSVEAFIASVWASFSDRPFSDASSEVVALWTRGFAEDHCSASYLELGSETIDDVLSHWSTTRAAESAADTLSQLSNYMAMVFSVGVAPHSSSRKVVVDHAA